MSNWIFPKESNETPVKPGNESLGGVLIAGILTIIAAALAHGAGWCLKKILDKITGTTKKDGEVMKRANNFNNDKPRELYEHNMIAIKKIDQTWQQKNKEAKLKCLNTLLPSGYDEILPLISDAILSTAESSISLALLCHQCHVDQVKAIIKGSLFVKNPLEIAIGVNSAIKLDHLYRWHFSPRKSENENLWKGWQQLNERGYAIYKDIMSAGTPEEIAKKVLASQSVIEKLENDADDFESKNEKIYNNWEGILIDSDQEYNKRLNSDSQEAVTIISALLDWKLQRALVKSEIHYKDLTREGVYKLEYDGGDKLAELGETMDSKASGIVDHLFATLYGIVYVGSDIAYPYSNTSHELNDVNANLTHRLDSMAGIINKMQKNVRVGTECFSDDETHQEETNIQPGNESLGITLLAVGAALAGAVQLRKKYLDMKIKHKLHGDVEQYFRRLNAIDRNAQVKTKAFSLLATRTITELDKLLRDLASCSEDVLKDLKTIAVMGEAGVMKSLRDLDETMLSDVEKNIVYVKHLRDQYQTTEPSTTDLTVHDVLSNRAKLDSVLKNIARIEKSISNESDLLDKIDKIEDDLKPAPEVAKQVFSAALQGYSEYSKLFLSISDDINDQLETMFAEITRMTDRNTTGNESVTDPTPAIVENANNVPVWTESDTRDGWAVFDTFVEEEPTVTLGNDEGTVDVNSIAIAAKLNEQRVGIEQFGMSRAAFVACESLHAGVFHRLKLNQMSTNPSRTGKQVALECLDETIELLRTTVETPSVQPESVEPEVNPAVESMQLNAIARVVPRSQWILPGMEAIDHQLNSKLYARLIEAVKYMRQSKDYSPKNFQRSGFNAAIFEETGMRINVELDNDSVPNAYVYIPEIDINNSILPFNFGSILTNDSLLDLKNAIGRATVGLIDRAKSRVDGAFSNLLIKSCITKGLFTSPLFTDEEVAAVMMHECGHVYTYFERLVDVVSMNYAISAVTTRLLKTEDKKVKVELLHEFDEAFGIKIPDAEVVAESKSGETIATRLIVETLKQRRNAEGELLYAARGFEFSSDQFATRHGGGKALITSLDKMYTEYGDPSYSCWTVHVLKQLVVVIVTLAGMIVTAYAPPYLILILIMIFIIRPLDKTYDETPHRFARVRREIIDSLKDRNVPADYRRRTLDDLAAIDKILSGLEYKRDWLEAVWTYIIPSGRKANAHMALQHTLEKLANSDLVIAASKFQLLTEDMKNA